MVNKSELTRRLNYNPRIIDDYLKIEDSK